MNSKFFIKIFYLSCLGIVSFVFSNCKKKEDKIAFEHATMKPWFETNCGSCHADGKPYTGSWKMDLTDFKTAFTDKKATLYKVIATDKTMPQGVGLTAMELKKFTDWYDSGMPAK